MVLGSDEVEGKPSTSLCCGALRLCVNSLGEWKTDRKILSQYLSRCSSLIPSCLERPPPREEWACRCAYWHHKNDVFCPSRFPAKSFWSDSDEKKKRSAGQISARAHCETKTSFEEEYNNLSRKRFVMFSRLSPEALSSIQILLSSAVASPRISYNLRPRQHRCLHYSSCKSEPLRKVRKDLLLRSPVPNLHALRSFAFDVHQIILMTWKPNFGPRYRMMTRRLVPLLYPSFRHHDSALWTTAGSQTSTWLRETYHELLGNGQQQHLFRLFNTAPMHIQIMFHPTAV